jgi:outer membrane lipoprotein SlyB
MNTHVTAVAALLVATATVSLDADRIRLRSGKTVDGVFIGGDSKTVRILLDDGSVSEVPLANTVAVEFSPRKPPAAPAATPTASKPPAAAPAAAPAPAAVQRPAVTVPAGTPINVRLSQAIDVDVSQAGQRYKGIVDDPVMVGGAIVVPRGASATLQAVHVEQSGQMKGSDRITLKVNTVSFGGTVYEVTTAYVESKGKGEGKKTARKVGGGAGLGAIVGGIAGGGEGAAIGAAIGGVTGAAVASGGEEHLKLPAETRLQFQLTHAITIR